MSPEIRVRLGTSGAAGTTAVAFVAVPERAGGGHSSNRGSSGFSRSSGSSSRSTGTGTGTGFTSGRGGSGGFGAFIFGFICLIIVILVIVVAVSMLFKGRGRATEKAGGPAMPAGDPDPPPPPPPYPMSAEGQEAIARIKARDAGFDEDGFENFVGTCWYLVQKAWCEKIPSESRKVMADGIWVDHKRKIDDMSANGKTNVMEDLHIGRIDLVAAQADADAESITARIHAYGRDFTLDRNGACIDGDRLRRLWTEDWVFTRSASAITKQGQGTKENCPNCGAPLNLSDAGVCAYCNEMVMAGRHDWVLARIEQVYANQYAGHQQQGW